MITSSDKERFLQRVAGAREKQLLKCSCTDPNQCDTWCQAKERFTQKPEGYTFGTAWDDEELRWPKEA